MTGAGRPPAAWSARLAIAFVALVLAGCAGLASAPAPAGGEALSGRLAIRVEAADGRPARNENAAFELRGDARDGQLDLSTPLGSVLARARWSPDAVLLRTPRGENRYADLDALTRDVLGESLPVAALFDWLRGRPWPGAPSDPVPPPAPTGFAQLGWAVDVAGLGDGLIVARRERDPAMTVRARLDRP